MSADEVYLWLLPVMAFGAFLLGGFLLVRGNQAKAAGEESHKVKFLGVEIESSTSGTTLIILAIVVVVVVISLGIGRATDDGNGDNGADDRSSDTESPTDTRNTDTETPTDTPVEELDEDNVIDTGDLENATADIPITGWAPADLEGRPVLDCQTLAVVELNGHLARQGEKKNFNVGGGATANAMTTANLFDTAQNAADAYDRIVGYLTDCPNNHPDARPLGDPKQSGTRVTVDVATGRAVARNYWTSAEAECAGCIWIDSQAVGRIGRIVVLVSIDWYQSGPFDDTAAIVPITRAMQVAVDLADN